MSVKNCKAIKKKKEEEKNIKKVIFFPQWTTPYPPPLLVDCPLKKNSFYLMAVQLRRMVGGGKRAGH